MAAETIPASIRDMYADWRWTPAWEYAGRVTVWRLGRAGETRYCKVAPSDTTFPLTREASAMQWARAFIRVPEILDSGSADGLDWLVTAALPGVDATKHEWKSTPERLIPVLAEGLRRFHDTLPVKQCPFRLTVPRAIEICRARIDGGLAVIDDIHEEFRGLGVEGAFAEMARRAPATEDLVVCHGDYCFPNVLIEDGTVTGYVDLSELNVADRWWDIAIGMWSTTWNVGPGYEALFAESYGVDVDHERLVFYRMMYSLIS